MQTSGRLLEPNYSRSRMHRPTTLHYYQWRVESLDRRSDPLSSYSHGLGPTYNKRSESDFDRHFSVRAVVSRVVPGQSFFIVTDSLIVYV